MKRLLLSVLLTLCLLLSFYVGTKASGQWQGLAKQKAATDIEAIANSKYVELVTDFETTMQQAVDNEIANVVTDKRAVIEQALEAYFEGKLDELSESEPFLAVKSELDQLTDAKIAYYKEILDGLFGY